MAKANAIVKYGFDDESKVHSFTFPKLGTLTFTEGKLNAGLIPRAVTHGLKQKLSDSMAIATVDGKRPTEQARFDALKKRIEHFESGSAEWNVGRGTVGPTLDTQLLLKALFEVTPRKDGEETEAFEARIVAGVGKWSAQQRMAVSQEAVVKEVMDRLRDEVTEDIDTEDLLAGL